MHATHAAQLMHLLPLSSPPPSTHGRILRRDLWLIRTAVLPEKKLSFRDRRKLHIPRGVAS